MKEGAATCGAAGGTPTAPVQGGSQDPPPVAQPVPMAQAVPVPHQLPTANQQNPQVVVIVSDSGQGGRAPFGIDLRVGVLCGIPIHVHVSLPLICILYIAQYAMIGGGTGAGIGVVVSLVLIISVLIHEMGHALWARRVGGHCEKILLWPLGGLAYCAHHEGHREQVQILLAGPLTHIPQFLFWAMLQAAGNRGVITLTLFGLSDPGQAWRNLTATILLMQLLLLIFNLLPVYPLDGGQIVASFLLMRGNDPNTAAKTTAMISFPCACVLVLVGIIQMARNMPGGLLTCLVGGWMAFQASKVWNLYQQGHAEFHPLFAPRTGGESPGGGDAYATATTTFDMPTAVQTARRGRPLGLQGQTRESALSNARQSSTGPIMV
mmetsp:Transcript_4866/g.11299  ORF Transcript_4866/g.11299 Transcript_4866/m.11299 type:complete len:378 (+) Transcript_4866:80-1213(+)